VRIGAAADVDADIHRRLDGRRASGDFGAARPDANSDAAEPEAKRSTNKPATKKRRQNRRF